MNITGIDSIRKKINSVQTIKETLCLKNLTLICDRVENLKDKNFDIVVSRAVADLSKIAAYALPLTKQNGYFIAYKSKKAVEEIDGAKDVIKYRLPLDEVYERSLICIKKL
jgi:16S rRNA (guanine527-N7)-methyltransferase